MSIPVEPPAAQKPASSIKKKRRNLHGWLALDKPHGMTSTEAVRQLKKLTNAKKVGHAGTLDPLATGILPVAFGEATKTVPYLMNAEKTYIFTVKWGENTTTLDAEGSITRVSSLRPQKEEIMAALQTFPGRKEQVPPQFSALKINGKRAYDLARNGENITLPSRPVLLHEAVLERLLSCDEAVFRLRTGKGFYIRSFVRDLAEKLGCCGYVKQLRRIKVGAFTEKEAILLEDFEEIIHNTSEIERKAFLGVETALADIPAVAIQTEEACLLKQGRSIVLLPHQKESLAQNRKAASLTPEEAESDEQYRVVVFCRERAIAIGEARAGRLSPKRVFHFN